MKSTLVLPVILVLSFSLVLQIVGCGKKTPTDRLVRIEMNQKNLERQLRNLKEQIDSLRRGIAQLRETVQGYRTQPVVAAGIDDTSDTDIILDESASSPAEKKLYKDLSLRIAKLQQQLDENRQTVEQLDGYLEEAQRSIARRPPPMREVWENMRNPEVINKNLDALASGYAEKIEDPNTRYEFEQDIERLKEMTEKVNDSNLYDYVHNRLVEQIENTDDEQSRNRLSSMLESLSTTEDEEELQQRLERYIVFDNMRQLREVAQKYNIPTNTLRDHGIYVRPDRGRRRDQ